MTVTSRRHVVTDVNGPIRRLVLQEADQEPIGLTIQGRPPDRLRFEGSFWVLDTPALQGPPLGPFYRYRPEDPVS